MRIGISVASHEGQNIWENGLGQNVIFLARSLQKLPMVREVRLVDVGNQGCMPPQVDLQAMDLGLVTQREATDLVDVVIEAAGALDPKWLGLMRARGKKVVYFCAGQPYSGLIEPSIFDKAARFGPAERCDEVWLTPKYTEFQPLMRTLHRCPVRAVPYLWHPQFVQQRMDEVQALGFSFGYTPALRQAPDGAGRRGMRVAIFEPNVSLAKVATIPMLACDEAYRAEPDSIAAMHVLNTGHLKNHPTLLYLVHSLDLVRQHKAAFLERHDVVGFMAQNADAVVSHQWANDQNNSYMDVLYGNYPLVHNSPWLRGLSDAGYYYHGFDAAEGGRQLRRAAREHDTQLADYRARSQKVFDAVDPFAAANLARYAERLMALTQAAPEVPRS